MKLSPWLVLLIVCIFAATQPAAWCWGPEGHRVVAQIAWDHLTPAAKAQVSDLLAGEAEPSLPGVANWADEVRSDARESAPWHFVNFEPGNCHYTPALCPDGKCVVDAIQRFSGTLADKSASQDSRVAALKYVTHFVGDVHQPLHAGWRDDKGGNTFQVRFDGRGSNLHHIWDSGLIDDIDRDWQRLAARLSRREALPGALSRAAPEAWAEESCAVVSTPGFYPADREVGADYVQQWRGTVEDRLTIAGQRLAAVLNRALP